MDTLANNQLNSLPNTLLLEGVSHRYGALLAVDNVTIAVAPGEIVCLVGPSGCGKTTMLRLAAGLEPLQQGRVSIGGDVVDGDGRHVPPERRGVGLVFQDYALFPHLSVRDNIAFGLSHIPSGERRARVDRALARIEMASFAETYPHALSGGQQQRVALARAVVTEPRVVLLDEPFSGLDTRLRDMIRDDATQILRETGVATLMVTHDPEEAMYVADRIVVMKEGRLHQIATPSDIYTNPADAFVAGFFSEVNRLICPVSGGRAALPYTGFAKTLAVKMAGVLAENAPKTLEILIRQEALALDVMPDGGTSAGSTPVRVVAARYLGRASLVDVAPVAGATDGPGGCTRSRLRVRVPGRFLPPAGTVLSLTLDAAGAFVYRG